MLSRLVLLLSTTCLLTCAVPTFGQTYAWTKQAGNAGWDQAKDITTDRAGNVVVLAEIYGSCIFDSIAVSGGNVGLAKYDSTGRVLWARAAFAFPHKVVTDSQGNIYVLTDFQETAQFGSVIITDTAMGNSALVKYNSAGVLQWVRHTTGGGRGGYLSAHTIAIDNKDNIIIGGNYTYSHNFGPLILSYPVAQDGSRMFLAKCSQSGQWLWTQTLNGHTSWNDLTDISVSSQGSIYVSGFTVPSFNNPNGIIGNIPIPAHSLPSFIAKCNAQGNVVWTKHFFYSSNQINSSITHSCIAASPDGGVVVAGGINGTVISGTDTIKSIYLAQTGSVFKKSVLLSKYDSLGNMMWSYVGGRRISPSDALLTNDVACDINGDIYLIGSAYGTFYFDSLIVDNQSKGNFFITKHRASANGAPEWLFAGKGTANVDGNALSINSRGTIHLIGQFGGTASSPAYIGTDTLIQLGTDDRFGDIFFTKLTQPGLVMAAANEQPVEQPLRLWPNPASGQIYVYGNAAPDASPKMLQIYNTAGILVHEQEVPAHALSGGTAFTLPALASGIYLLRIAGKTSVQRAKLVIMK